MKARIASAWEAISVSFWFVPLLLVLAGIGMAQAAIYLDARTPEIHFTLRPWLYAGDIEGARQFLSGLATALITVAGVTFSITMVALTITSSQFGPRLLRNFMKDRGNQVVLGAFIGTFVYCMLTSSAIRAEGEGISVPRLTVSLGIILTVIDLGLLVYFFHHVANSIVATTVVARAYHDLADAINRMLPKNEGEAADRRETRVAGEPDDGSEDFLTVRANAAGYLKAINEEDLLKLAERKDIVIRALYRPGDFVFSRTALAHYRPGQLEDAEVGDEIRKGFLLGSRRTPLQDIEFSITQLVEVALRALSPGINDPFTAMNCLDRLGEAVSLIADRPFPSTQRYDSHGQLRLVLDVTSFHGIMDAAFHQIRQNATTKVDVTIRLLEVLAMLAETSRTSEQRAAIRRHAELVRRGTADGLPDESSIEERYGAVLSALASHDVDSRG